MIPKEILRGRVARIIAVTRFPFVDQTDWIEDNVTIANVGRDRTWSFDGPDGKVYPSLVVLHGDGSLRELGQVEMEDEVDGHRVPYWRTLSENTAMGVRVKKFFLYVPEGREGLAERLLEENGIEYAGLRTWAVRDGHLVVKPVKTIDEAKDHR
jgi:hypothetical protein